jgi:hypothetical protein
MLQEVAQGSSLADMVASGWRADEAEVTRIATELLDILGYLAARRPPVIHRWGRGGSEAMRHLAQRRVEPALAASAGLDLPIFLEHVIISSTASAVAPAAYLLPQGCEAGEHCD